MASALCAFAGPRRSRTRESREADYCPGNRQTQLQEEEMLPEKLIPGDAFPRFSIHRSRPRRPSATSAAVTGSGAECSAEVEHDNGLSPLGRRSKRRRREIA